MTANGDGASHHRLGNFIKPRPLNDHAFWGHAYFSARKYPFSSWGPSIYYPEIIKGNGA